jgi:hypothetical protein
VATTTTQIPGAKSATADGTLTRAKKRFALRPWLRALHRDIGYFAVGLTFIYALSGLAVNHIADWDPNFRQFEKTHRLERALAGSDAQVSNAVLGALAIEEKPRDVYRASANELEIVFDQRTLHVNTTNGVVREEGQSARPFLRLANWLHLNRGKKAWTYVADAYAIFLLFLATSGLFMIPGRKGLIGRGAAIALSGALLPAAYVIWSGGP